MTIKTRAEAFTAENVTTFKTFDVINGEVCLTEREYIDRLDECYDSVMICGMSYSAGRALSEVDPTAFRCGKGDYESELQSELEEQLEREDESDIEFDVHPDDVEEEEEQEEDEE